MNVENALKQRLRDYMEAEDLHDGVAAKTEVEEETTKDTETVGHNDPLLDAGDSATQVASSLLGDIDTVEVTEEDKEAFLTAVISGTRYRRPFSLFGGRIKGVLRARSAEESDAIASWTNFGVTEGRYASAADYGADVRNSLLVAQVEEFNGITFDEMATPLKRTVAKGDTEPSDPGWLVQCAYWAKQPEAIVSPVYNEIREFERKYWAMVREAASENFWNPVEST